CRLRRQQPPCVSELRRDGLPRRVSPRAPLRGRVRRTRHLSPLRLRPLLSRLLLQQAVSARGVPARRRRRGSDPDARLLRSPVPGLLTALFPHDERTDDPPCSPWWRVILAGEGVARKAGVEERGGRALPWRLTASALRMARRPSRGRRRCALRFAPRH